MTEVIENCPKADHPIMDKDNNFLNVEENGAEKALDNDYFVIKTLGIKLKNGSKDFGFSIRQDEYNFPDIPYYVDYVDPNGSAFPVLAVGDLLVELNRESTKNRSYLSLKFAIKQASYTGRLIVKILRTPFAKYINEQCNPEPLYNLCPSPITSSRVSVCETIESDKTNIPTRKVCSKKSVLSKAYLYEESRRKEKMEDAQNAFLEWKTRRKSKMHSTDNFYDYSSNTSSMFNLSEISQDTPYMDYKATLALKPNKITMRNVVEKLESPIALKPNEPVDFNSDTTGQKQVQSRSASFRTKEKLETNENFLLDKRLSPPLHHSSPDQKASIKSRTTTPVSESFHTFLDPENYGDKDKQISDKISESSDSGLSFATADAHESSSYSLIDDRRSSLNLSSTFDSIIPEKDCAGTLTPCGAETPKSNSSELTPSFSTSSREDIPTFTFPKIKQIIPSFEGYKSNLPSLFQLEQKILQSKTPKHVTVSDISKTSLEAKIEALQTHSTSIKYVPKYINESLFDTKKTEAELQNDLVKEIDESKNENMKNVQNETANEGEIMETAENSGEELKIINMTLSSNDEDNSDENDEISSQFDQTPSTETIQEPEKSKNLDLKPEVESCLDGNTTPEIQNDSQKGKRLIHPIKLVKFEFALKPTVQCRGCGKDLINDQALICVKDLNYHYHLGCFKCSICDYSAGNRFKNILSSSYSDDLEIDLPPVKIVNNLINCISCD